VVVKGDREDWRGGRVGSVGDEDEDLELDVVDLVDDNSSPR